MSENTPAVGDSGIVIMLATGISAASAQAQILYRKPDGTTGAWTGTAYDTDGEQGISYTTQPGDLDQAGTWTLQARIDTGSTVLTGEASRLTVRSRIDEASA
ncbi:MAG: hypothetical protein ACOC0Q_10950 [Wenzhouxiangella sp.]